MREILKTNVEAVMLCGINPAGAYQMHKDLRGVDPEELWDVIQEVAQELADKDIIHWEISK